MVFSALLFAVKTPIGHSYTDEQQQHYIEPTCCCVAAQTAPRHDGAGAAGHGIAGVQPAKKASCIMPSFMLLDYMGSPAAVLL
jgi:hypothetical protein